MTTQPRLPEARGELSAAINGYLRAGAGALPKPESGGDPLEDEDLQLALYICYEQHYRGWADVDSDLEWDPIAIAFRRDAEASFEASLRASAASGTNIEPSSVPEVLRDLSSGALSPLAEYLARDASLEQFREFVIHRSAYHLKEADPHTWVIPRLSGTAKAALVEIQSDEYGGGIASRMHAALFADTMVALGLDATYGHYLERIPGSTLATVNLMSLVGLNRRLRGAAMGHLAAFELGSSIPNAAYARGLRRLGIEGAALVFYDEHVVADSVHDMIATYDLAGTLAQSEPSLADDIVFGAKALGLLEARSGDGLLRGWRAGFTSLLPVPSEAAALPALAQTSATRPRV
jgi:hypothetical protein